MKTKSYRHQLPQLGDELFLTDGGLETTLVFHERIDLPCFAAFQLLKTESGMAILRRYFTRYLELAERLGTGVVLETATWRANPDWGIKLGYDARGLATANRQAVELLEELRCASANPHPIVISGNLGPRGDGYRVETRMSIAESRAYHAPQIEVFAGTTADMVAAFTMNYVEEASGIVMAAREAELPVAIAFTVETDGRLPSGQPLGEAIEQTDATTDRYPAYYLINCAHPTHFKHVLTANEPWRHRLRGLRANASQRSHAELDASADLDAGNPVELAEEYRELRSCLPALNVVGGCCGTDHRHVEAMGRALQKEKL